MTIKSEIWIIAFNLVILFALLVFFRRQISKGRINENKFAILACGYMSFLNITMWLPAFILIPHFFSSIYMSPLVISLSLIWFIGYPFFRWVCRKINLRNYP